MYIILIGNNKRISINFNLSFQDQNYFSEPEIESDYHHQHVHKSKVSVAFAQVPEWSVAGKWKFLSTTNLKDLKNENNCIKSRNVLYFNRNVCSIVIFVIDLSARERIKRFIFRVKAFDII